MSFRSMLLLRRSTDLDEGERVGDGDVAVSKVEGGIVIVETRPREMSHLVAILESLNFQTLSVTEDSVALRLIQERLPRMVLSSRRLPPIEGYDLHRDLPQTAPFVYIHRPKAPQNHALQEEQIVREAVTPSSGESVQKGEPEIPVDEGGHQEPFLVEPLATVEDILRGFRESETEEDVDRSEEAEEDSGDSAVEPDDEEEDLSRILSYREEYQTQHKNQDVDRKSHDPSVVGEQVKIEQDDVPETVPIPEDLIRHDPEGDYSIIERINAEEIACLSHDDSLGEKAEKSDPSTRSNLYQEARSYVLDSIRAAEGGKVPDLVKGESVAERIVLSIEAGSELLISATDRRQEFAISYHSVNTAVFAVRIARALSLSRWQQLRIALAALLHEIGVVRLPKQLIYKTKKPTLEEIKILRQRPIYASRCLKEVDPSYDWLAEVVGQVYERENGTGHPLGLTGREICEEAKVIGISDLFDACIHRRPYREALTGYQALFELTTDQARTFSDRIVKALIKSLSLFPYNEFVELSSGEIGRVVEINLENLSRPVVELMYGKEGGAAKSPKLIDLAQNPSLYIAKAMPYRDLPSS